MKTDPDARFSYAQVVKMRNRIVPMEQRGQVIVRKWPKKRGKKKTPAQQAWVDYFSCLASTLKQPHAKSVDFANAYKKDSRWYNRDFFYAAARGLLMRWGTGDIILTPTASVTKLVAGAAAVSADTKITPTAQEWDNNQFWNPSVNPSRLTIRSAGLYLIGAELEFSAVSGGNRRCWIKLNNTTFISRAEVPGTNTGAQQVGPVRIYYFEEGDYIEVGYFQTASGVTVKLNTFWCVAITPEGLISN